MPHVQLFISTSFFPNLLCFKPRLILTYSTKIHFGYVLLKKKLHFIFYTIHCVHFLYFILFIFHNFLFLLLLLTWFLFRFSDMYEPIRNISRHLEYFKSQLCGCDTIYQSVRTLLRKNKDALYQIVTQLTKSRYCTTVYWAISIQSDQKSK